MRKPTKISFAVIGFAALAGMSLWQAPAEAEEGSAAALKNAPQKPIKQFGRSKSLNAAPSATPKPKKQFGRSKSLQQEQQQQDAIKQQQDAIKQEQQQAIAKQKAMDQKVKATAAAEAARAEAEAAAAAKKNKGNCNVGVIDLVIPDPRKAVNAASGNC